eukprot:TRINITY_DN14192_c0_g1_i1.p1 TRINITY_DN14192_c0_g1~~TRINITY_DN14192_c0_g1_i1.p1  ORF type:complete len:402 (+),score=49.89 TRINITY_DN14192_c0_g1_i1:31-1236(+)
MPNFRAGRGIDGRSGPPSLLSHRIHRDWRGREYFASEDKVVTRLGASRVAAPSGFRGKADAILRRWRAGFNRIRSARSPLDRGHAAIEDAPRAGEQFGDSRQSERAKGRIRNGESFFEASMQRHLEEHGSEERLRSRGGWGRSRSRSRGRAAGWHREARQHDGHPRAGRHAVTCSRALDGDARRKLAESPPGHKRPSGQKMQPGLAVPVRQGNAQRVAAAAARQDDEYSYYSDNEFERQQERPQQQPSRRFERQRGFDRPDARYPSSSRSRSREQRRGATQYRGRRGRSVEREIERSPRHFDRDDRDPLEVRRHTPAEEEPEFYDENPFRGAAPTRRTRPGRERERRCDSRASSRMAASRRSVDDDGRFPEAGRTPPGARGISDQLLPLAWSPAWHSGDYR